MSNCNFISAIDTFPDISILVIGDIMLDIYEYCLVTESKILHSERPDRRAYKSQRAVKVLGGAGNVAANLASLNVKTSLVSVTGNDGNYFTIRDLCESLRISHALVQDPVRPTTTKSRLYIDDEYILRRDDETLIAIGDDIAATLLREILRLIPHVQAVILSDYNKGLFTESLSQNIIRECRIHAVPVIVDFKPSNRHYFAGADIISPNEVEAKEIMLTFSLDALEPSTIALHRMLLCDGLVVTLGSNGLSGFDGREYFHVPAHNVKAYDAVGCGDTVRAGIALGKTLGMSLRQSAELANYAAAVIVQKPNTSALTALELKTFIEEHA